jgi:hypothetical protein
MPMRFDTKAHHGPREAFQLASYNVGSDGPVEPGHDGTGDPAIVIIDALVKEQFGLHHL